MSELKNVTAFSVKVYLKPTYMDTIAHMFVYYKKKDIKTIVNIINGSNEILLSHLKDHVINTLKKFYISNDDQFYFTSKNFPLSKKDLTDIILYGAIIPKHHTFNNSFNNFMITKFDGYFPSDKTNIDKKSFIADTIKDCPDHYPYHPQIFNERFNLVIEFNDAEIYSN